MPYREGALLTSQTKFSCPFGEGGNCFAQPLIPAPFGVIEAFAVDQCDKSLGFDGAKGFDECRYTFMANFCISSHVNKGDSI